jgi:hypothetical protein
MDAGNSLTVSVHLPPPQTASDIVGSVSMALYPQYLLFYLRIGMWGGISGKI